MSLINKILITLGVFVVLGMLSVIIYQQIQINKRQQAIEAQVVAQKQLVDGIVRSQNEYTTKKDLENFIKDNGINLKAIQDDVKKLRAEVIAANVVTVISKPQNGTFIPTTNTGPDNPNTTPPTCQDGKPCPNADPYGYLKSQQNLLLSEDFGTVKVPIGSVGFSAWQDKPWTLDIKSRTYSVSNVIGVDENQRTYFYNKFTVTVGDKTYTVPITKAETKQEYPDPKWYFWNPRLYLGVDSGITLSAPLRGEISPGVSLAIMSYGKFKTQPDFTVLGLGVGYGAINKSAQFSLTPFTYNIGKHIPLMTNVHLGPSLQINASGDFSVMGSIKVGL